MAKGEHPLTENYPVFTSKVLTGRDGQPLAARNTALERFEAAGMRLVRSTDPMRTWL